MDPTGEIQKYLQQKGLQHAVIKGMLDQFAHDLAEAIRAQHEEICEPFGDLCTCGDNADFIDPEVG